MRKKERNKLESEFKARCKEALIYQQLSSEESGLKFMRSAIVKSAEARGYGDALYDLLGHDMAKDNARRLVDSMIAEVEEMTGIKDGLKEEK